MPAQTPANGNDTPTQKRGRPVQQQLIKFGDAAKRWGVSIDLLKQMVERGELTPIRLSDGPTAAKFLLVAEMDAIVERRLAEARGDQE